MSDSIQNAAIDLAGRGYAVFPCRPGTKIPATQHGFKDAQADVAAVNRWWTANPAANIGIATGAMSGVVVIDVDQKNGKDGKASLAVLEAELGALPACPESSTPTGGRHLFFAHPGDGKVPCSKNRVAEGIDIRADGGYIVVPPSKIPDGDYSWVAGLDDAGLPEIPPAWLERIRNPPAPPAPPAPSKTKQADPEKRAMAYLAKCPAAVSGDGGHDATLRAACECYRFGLDDAAAARCLDWFNLNRCSPPWTHAELAHKLHDARAKVAGEGKIGARLAEGASGGTVPRTADAPVRSAGLINLSTVKAEPIRWLWPGRIARGKITVVAGDPGLGKSFLTMDLSGRVSTGSGWPDAPGERFEPAGVVLLNAEDDLADTIRPRLDSAGADVARINALTTGFATDPATGATIRVPFTLEHLPTLEDAIQNTPDCRLVIIDPVSAYLGGTDSHKNADVRALLAPLSELAARYSVALLLVSHLNKSSGGAALYRTTGSLAFVAAARAAFIVAKDKNDPSGKRRLFLPAKNNIGPDQTGLAFEVRAIASAMPAIAWEAEPVATTADQALAVDPGRPGPEPAAREEAADFLRDALANGARLARDVEEEAIEMHDIKKATLRRAKDDVGVEVYREKVPGPWLWRLVSQGAQQGAHLGPVPNNLSILSALEKTSE